MNRNGTETVRYEQILSGLRRLGVREGDVILAHSSLSSFGYVEGGADTVIRALLDAVGPAGTVVVPTLSFGSVDESDPYFSVNDTPSDTGRITEEFRKRPEARRSRHPLSSAAAIGKDAERIAGGRQMTPCGEDSPYARVYQADGRVVFLGAGFKSNTLFHVAEEIVHPPYMRYKKLENVRIRTASGQIEIDTFYRYDCYQTGIIRRLERLEDIYREKGLIRETQIGACRAMLIPAKANVDVACDVLKHRVDFILE